MSHMKTTNMAANAHGTALAHNSVFLHKYVEEKLCKRTKILNLKFKYLQQKVLSA